MRCQGESCPTHLREYRLRFTGGCRAEYDPDHAGCSLLVSLIRHRRKPRCVQPITQKRRWTDLNRRSSQDRIYWVITPCVDQTSCCFTGFKLHLQMKAIKTSVRNKYQYIAKFYSRPWRPGGLSGTPRHEKGVNTVVWSWQTPHNMEKWRSRGIRTRIASVAACILPFKLPTDIGSTREHSNHEPKYEEGCKKQETPDHYSFAEQNCRIIC